MGRRHEVLWMYTKFLYRFSTRRKVDFFHQLKRNMSATRVGGEKKEAPCTFINCSNVLS
jgi:hypothetical protein